MSNKHTFEVLNKMQQYDQDADDGYGGVGIIAHNKIKVVNRPELSVAGLEAIWVEVCIPGYNKKCLFGSVYIHVGDIDNIRLFDETVARISQSYDSMVIGMDSNARNQLWDSSPLVYHGRSRRMGNILSDVVSKHNLYEEGLPVILMTFMQYMYVVN